MIKAFFQNLFGTKETPKAKTETNKTGKARTGTAHKGTVKFYNSRKGFGFINRNNSEEELFFHKTNLNDRVKENDHVTFDLETTDKGLAAVNVNKVKKIPKA